MCAKCGHIECICAIKEQHDANCRFRISASCAVPVECEHGYDVCPICDPCTCRSEVASEVQMRVWQVNEFDVIAGATFLKAARAARKQIGLAWWELIDRDHFHEIQPTDWGTIGCYDPDTPDKFDLTLYDAVVAMREPGVVMSSHTS